MPKGKRAARYASFRNAVRKATAASVAAMPPRPPGHTLNHIIPVSRAFTMGLTADETGSVANLEWMPYQENLQLGSMMTPAGIAVLRVLGRHDLADAQEMAAATKKAGTAETVPALTIMPPKGSTSCADEADHA